MVRITIKFKLLFLGVIVLQALSLSNIGSSFYELVTSGHLKIAILLLNLSQITSNVKGTRCLVISVRESRISWLAFGLRRSNNIQLGCQSLAHPLNCFGVEKV